MSHKKHSEYPSRAYLFFVSTTIHSYPLFISIHLISCKNKCDLFVEKTLYKWRTRRCSTRRCKIECLETYRGMDSCLFIHHFIQTWNSTIYEDLSNSNSSHWMRIGPSRRCPCSHKQCPYSQTFPKQIQQNTPILYIPAIRILALTLEP